MNFPMICPRCEQGYRLHRAIIPEVPAIVYVCQECDVLYHSEDDIKSLKFEHLSLWLAEKCIEIEEDEIVIDSPESFHLASGILRRLRRP